VIVHVEMPDQIWGRLANLADQRGVRVADLVADAVAEIAGVPKRRRSNGPVVTPMVEARLRELHALNRSWKVIAAELGVPLPTVYRAAQRFGLRSIFQESLAKKRSRK
jgi:transcriptional regulator of acetoin/glycerol metabolism